MLGTFRFFEKTELNVSTKNPVFLLIKRRDKTPITEIAATAVFFAEYFFFIAFFSSLGAHFLVTLNLSLSFCNPMPQRYIIKEDIKSKKICPLEDTK